MADKNSWQPPEFVSRDRCVKDTEEILGMPDLPIRSTEDIFRISTLGMDWDLGMVVHEPVDSRKIPTGADGKKAGFFCCTAVRVTSRASSATPRCSPANSGFG